MWKSKDKKYTFYFSLYLGIGLTLGAIYAFIIDYTAVGISLRFFQPTIINGYYFLILGLSNLIIAYFLFEGRKIDTRNDSKDALIIPQTKSLRNKARSANRRRKKNKSLSNE